MNKEEDFITRDLGLAATLVTLGIFYNRIDFSQEGTNNSAVGYFIFPHTDGLKEKELQYKRGQLLVEPKSYLASIHALKAEVMNFLKNPHNKQLS